MYTLAGAAGLFIGHEAEIVKMIRAVQKKVQRQEQQRLMQNMLENFSSEEMAKEVEAISSLRELNPQAYEMAMRAIVQKYGGG
ncbi:MAG: hypothetical protein R2911_38990 [Caldilineaceae bacterium]